MSSPLSKKDVPLGWSMHVSCVKALTDFNHRVNEHLIWIDEVIAEAKKTLATDDVELLPKTPSSKKTKRRINSRRSGSDNVVPKRTLRSASRLSGQSSLDLSADGKLPERRKASCYLDAIKEHGENVNAVKSAVVRIADDESKRKGGIENEHPVASKCIYNQVKEITNKLNESESSASVMDSAGPKVAIARPVARKGTRKRKTAADTEKDPAMLDISYRETIAQNEPAKDDKLCEEKLVIGNKFKRPRTSSKNASATLGTKMCDLEHETESNLIPEDDHISDNVFASSSDAKRNEDSVRHTESILEGNCSSNKMLEISRETPKMTDLFEAEHDEYVKQKSEMDKAVNKKDRLDTMKKECEMIGSVESSDNGEEGAVSPVLVDSVFEHADQKGSMSEDSLECDQELNLVQTSVPQPTSVHMISRSVEDSRILIPSVPSDVAECKLVSVEPEQTEITPSEVRAAEVSEAEELEAVPAKSHTLSTYEDREAAMTAAALIKGTGKAEDLASVSCLSHSNVISDESKSPFKNSVTVSSNSKSSRNEELLSFPSKSSDKLTSKISVGVSSTESPDDSKVEVVFKASSSSSESSAGSPTVISTVTSPCSYSSGRDSATFAASSSSTYSGNSPTVTPKVISSTDALSGDVSVTLCAVALSSNRACPKVVPAACSSFMSWEPVSSVTDKVGAIANRSDPKLLDDQGETQTAILTESSVTEFLKKTPWSQSSDSVQSNSTAGVSPSRIYLKVHVKDSSVDKDNSDMLANCKMPLGADNPAKSDFNFESVSDNALMELCSPLACPSPVGNMNSPDHRLVDPSMANAPECDLLKNSSNKFFPTIGSSKAPEFELSHQGDFKDTPSSLKRFCSMVKVKLGGLLSSHGSPKSHLSPGPRTPGSLSIASSLSRSFKVVSNSPYKQENTAASSSPDKFSIAPIDDMETVTIVPEGCLPNAETSSPYSGPSVCMNTTTIKRKSGSRRSSVHVRLSTSHRRSSGRPRARLSKRFMSALKRKMSRAPAVSSPIKENVPVQNDASLADVLPFRNTRSKMRVLVAEVACDVAQDQEICSITSFRPEDNEDAVSDEDVVCDTPPVALVKTKVPIEQTFCGSMQHKKNLDEESMVNEGNVGTSASAVADCQLIQTPSTLKQKRPLGSRIKMLQNMICQSPAFSSKNKKKSNTSMTSNSSSVTLGIKTKKVGLWSTSQRRVSLKRTDKTKKSKVSSQWIDLNDSTSSKAGVASSASAFASSGSVIKTPIHPSSFLNLLSKKPSSSSVVSSGSIKSFITHNTPVKITREEQDEQKRKELEVKKKKLEEAEQRKQEQRLKKAEDLKRQREQRQMLAQQRREERQQKDLEQKREMMLKLEETSKASSRAAAERLREEREKQKLREKRIADAEHRRRQEAEARQQTALRLEKERELLEEQQRLRRDLEDQERQQKLNEQRRQEEERRKQLEQERLAEQERLRELEEQKLKEEQEKQRQKEERERKEKAERDRFEVERQRERERQKEIEIEKQKDAERQRLLVRQAEEELNQKDKPFVKAVEKHNQNLKTNSSMNSNTVLGIVQSAAKATTTACTSAARVPGTSASSVKTAHYHYLTTGSYTPAVAPAVAKPATKVLNTTKATTKDTTLAIVAEHDSDSYDMTPAQKIKNPATDENYDIADLHSDDSTDDDTKPRKKIPLWAQGTHLKASLIAQFTHPPDVDKIFGPVYELDLNDVFKKKKARFNKRTSSAAWDVPLLPKPASLKF